MELKYGPYEVDLPTDENMQMPSKKSDEVKHQSADHIAEAEISSEKESSPEKNDPESEKEEENIGAPIEVKDTSDSQEPALTSCAVTVDPTLNAG